MGGFTAINLENLPFPDVVESLDFETLLNEMIIDHSARAPEMAAQLQLESDPTRKLLEAVAYREMRLRQRVNEAAKNMMLAYARAADLDNAAAFYEVERQLITPADPDAYPPIEAVYESDEDLRRRTQLSVEGHSTAGPTGAYKFHALSAAPSVRDADIYSPTPGQVEVTILSTLGDGTPDQTLLDTVNAVVNDEFIRPLNDQVFVLPANIVNYSIDATLTFYAGPDAAVVMTAAQSAIDAYVIQQHRMGLDITVSGIHAALHQPGVQNVVLTSPAADLVIDHNQAPYCTSITLNNGGTDE